MDEPLACIHSALILLGSNIDRQRNLPAAIERLYAESQIRVVGVSSVYESEAVGGKGPQPVFANAAVDVETALSAHELRRRLRQIESEMGRQRSQDKYAPRPIDLDIALFDDLVADVDGSIIPDPDIERFPHVTVPLAEIAPQRRHPISGRTLQTISEELDRSALYKSSEITVYRKRIRNEFK
jgi:2-amino-4-hydroxy-6-hydroxymethyldihydropteridine diphosphokinase